MPPIDQPPASVRCPKCGQSGFANEAEMANRVPYRCAKCGFMWRAFEGESNSRTKP
jgi:rubredoxin